MKTILYMGIALNGIIAREDGGEDFLSDKNWETFAELAKKYGNFIVGRKTYEAVKKWDEDYSFDDLTGIEKIIISQDLSYQLDEGYTLAQSPQDATLKLKQKGFESALVTGGSATNTAFMKEGLLDEILLNIEPTIVGKGISLFSSADFESRLKLIEMKKLDDDIVQLHYKVIK